MKVATYCTENPFHDLFIATGSAIFVEDIETTFANTNQNDIKNQLREVKALIVDKDIMEKKGNATFWTIFKRFVITSGYEFRSKRHRVKFMSD